MGLATGNDHTPGDLSVVTPGRSIAAILVRELHGKFTYNLDVAPIGPSQDFEGAPPVASVTDDRLTLLFGTNGTGKTSLLRLLFHALSPAGDRGHRSALRRMRFREFLVRLTDSSYVRYLRDGQEDRGGFTAEVRIGPHSEPIKEQFFLRDQLSFSKEQLERYVTYHTTGLGDVDPGQVSWDMTTLEAQYALLGKSEPNLFLGGLRELGVNPVFLEDSRVITSDVLDESDARRMRARRAAQIARKRDPEADDDSLRRREIDVEEALERVRVYLSQLAFIGTQAGSLRVDNVYVSVAAAIIQHSSKAGRAKKDILPKLRAKVHALNERAARFQEYGLLPESPMLALADRLKAAEEKHGPVLEQVLTPHLDGFAERMDALEPGLEAVAAFVDSLNNFLADKRVSFAPGREGLSITDQRTDEQIGPGDLSSGEKQIVLMFSDIIALQSETRVFLIDEPELSLNPDWQRNLMPSLLNVTKSSGMQLIAATHSIEIMARYRDRRRQLPG
jgi:energy-coupling factor transporter ATP-binding protein EcfA2